TTVVVETNPLIAEVPYRVQVGISLVVSPRTVALGRLAVSDLGSMTLAGVVDLSELAAPLIPGDYRVFVELDPDGIIPELRKTNNRAGSTAELTVRGPNLAVIGVTAPDQAFAGQAYDVTLFLRNNGNYPAQGFGYTYVLTRDGVVTAGRPIGAGRIAGLPIGGEITVRDRLVLPETLATGLAQLGVIVDADAELVEASEEDNLFLRPGLLTVRAPVADLAGRIEASSYQAAAGDAMAATVVLRNDGFLPASFTYAYVLVDATGDREIARQTVTLGAGELMRVVEYVDVPDDIDAGEYRLDVVLDPEGVVEEVTEENNRLRGDPLVVVLADLRVATERPPSARLRVPYATTLRAVGGAFARTWRLLDGQLPPGLALFSDGRIEGTPTSDGVFVFSVQVLSGARSATRALSLAVDAADVPLSIQTTNLPYALVGRPYQAELVAVGGRAPVVWSATGLPVGLALTPIGQISGIPEEEGASEIALVAEDSGGVQLERSAVLRVLNPAATVRIAPTELPLAVVGQPYCDPEPVALFSNGGVAPYTWTATVPPGLQLSEAGLLCGIPAMAGRYTVVVSVRDSFGQLDTTSIFIDVRTNDEVAVRTTVLPDGTVDAPYAAIVEAFGGEPPYEWRLELGALPEGMSISSSGDLTGRPAVVGRSPFVVEVADARGMTAQRVLSVGVSMPFQPPSEGGACRCVRASSDENTPPWGQPIPLLIAAGLCWLGARRRSQAL
ncbi:MAG: putative Ig domain-containing protein, partial [Myxococcota bacterium]